MHVLSILSPAPRLLPIGSQTQGGPAHELWFNNRSDALGCKFKSEDYRFTCHSSSSVTDLPLFGKEERALSHRGVFFASKGTMIIQPRKDPKFANTSVFGERTSMCAQDTLAHFCPFRQGDQAGSEPAAARPSTGDSCPLHRDGPERALHW